MKKYIILWLFTLLSTVKSFSQSIYPVESTEVCPGVDITFTVSIYAQSIQNVIPWALNVNPAVVQPAYNISSNGTEITFNFVGRFSDNNNKQSFRVNYISLSGQSTSKDFTFTKVKSLLTPTPFSQISPTPTSITAQRCEVENFNISFSNVQYGNIWESPAISYGTVTNYEYLLPTGWKLGLTTSDGSTWLSGGNNVTITSDLSNGVNGSIQIRPTNTGCASGLVPGQAKQFQYQDLLPIFILAAQITFVRGTRLITFLIYRPEPQCSGACQIAMLISAGAAPAPQ